MDYTLKCPNCGNELEADVTFEENDWYLEKELTCDSWDGLIKGHCYLCGGTCKGHTPVLGCGLELTEDQLRAQHNAKIWEQHFTDFDDEP